MAATKFNGVNLSFTIAGTEYNGDVRSVVIENEEGETDAQTFADLSAGGAVDWTLTVEANSDYSNTSLWSYLWNNAGATAAYVLKPYGNATASATQPHFAGTLRVGAKPAIGGTAGETFSYEYTFTLTAAPGKTPA